MTITRREFEELRREVSRLQQGLAQRPIHGGGASSNRAYMLNIIGGNTLSDGVTNGIQWYGSFGLTVPAPYDPATDTSMVAGIGYAQLLIDGVNQGNVMVAHCIDTGSPLQVALFAGDIVLTSPSTIFVPKTGDATQGNACYVAYSP